MRHIRDRLYQSKLQLIAVVMTFSGVVLVLLAQLAETNAGWLSGLPLTDFGSALFTTGLLAVAFEYLDRKHGDERATQRFRQVLRAEAPAIRDAVVEGFASNAQALKDVAAPEVIDRIVVNALAIRLKDRDLAAEAYTDLRNQVIRAPERWHDVRVSVALAPWDKRLTADLGAMFVATVRWEYRVRPTNPTLRIACVSDLHEYRELLRDPATTSVWYFEPVGDLQASSPEAFELMQCTVNGQERRSRRATRRGAQLHTVNLSDEQLAGQEVTVAFTIRVLVQQASHLLHLDIMRPSHGLQVQLWYGDTGIRHVNAVDFIASAEQPRVQRTPANEPTPSITIGFDGWVFPRAGVAFVWVLASEID